MAFEAKIISMLEKLPRISYYAKTRGWHFIIAWCHRITGILLVILVWFHLYFFSTPYAPGGQVAMTRGFRSLIFSLVLWILAVPIIFHALNGGRLILYESFGRRNDETMLRWVFGLSIIYLAVLGMLMFVGNQSVSPFVFWLIMIVGALILAYGVGAGIWESGHSNFWRLQRITGGFLLVMVPAYLLSMHLSPPAGRETDMAITGMQRYFIQVVYVGLLVGVLYHGGYGIWSLLSDYLPSRILRRGLAFLVGVVMLVFGWIGVKTIITM